MLHPVSSCLQEFNLGILFSVLVFYVADLFFNQAVSQSCTLNLMDDFRPEQNVKQNYAIRRDD